MANILKCKLCKKDFEEREGLKGLKICPDCDDKGKSGIASRCLIVRVSGKHGGVRETPQPIWVAPGVNVISEGTVVNE